MSNLANHALTGIFIGAIAVLLVMNAKNAALLGQTGGTFVVDETRSLSGAGYNANLSKQYTG